MKIKQIIYENIQSHLYTTLDFPERGVVQIVGANSSGKSALFRPLNSIFLSNLHILENRVCLINWNKSVAKVRMSFHGVTDTLEVVISREVSETVYKYNSVNMGNLVVPVTNREAIKSILDDIYVNAGLSFQGAEMGVPFLTNTNTENYRLLSSALIDTGVGAAQENLNKVLARFKANKVKLENDIKVQEGIINSLKFYDTEKEKQIEKIAEKLLAIPEIETSRLYLNNLIVKNRNSMAPMPDIPSTLYLTRNISTKERISILPDILDIRLDYNIINIPTIEFITEETLNVLSNKIVAPIIKRNYIDLHNNYKLSTTINLAIQNYNTVRKNNKCYICGSIMEERSV